MEHEDTLKRRTDDIAAILKAGGTIDLNAGEPMPLPNAEPHDVEPPEHVSLDALAPTRAGQSLEDTLRKRREARAVAIDTLPAWPEAIETGHDCRESNPHGWGCTLNDALGGIRPGRVWAVGANGSGIGKTAFLGQLVDGLALRTAQLASDDEPLTPVLWLSEMSAAELTERTLARWLGVSLGAIGGAGRFYGREQPKGRDDLARLEHKALAGDLRGWREFVRDVDLRHATASGSDLFDLVLRRAVNPWRDKLARRYGRDADLVWPVVVVDPLQRFLDRAASPIEAQDELADDIARAARREGLVVLVTSDTNKAGATTGAGEGGRSEQGVAGSFRGSYVLQHAADAVIHVERMSEEDTTAEVAVSVIKNRNGRKLTKGAAARFTYATALGRFVAHGREALGFRGTS
jgi:hypothetical protein